MYGLIITLKILVLVFKLWKYIENGNVSGIYEL